MNRKNETTDKKFSFWDETGKVSINKKEETKSTSIDEFNLTQLSPQQAIERKHLPSRDQKNQRRVDGRTGC